MLRSILGVRMADKVSLGEIYERTKARKVWVVARSLKFKYAGHTIRDCRDKLNVILTLWVPYCGVKGAGEDPALGEQMNSDPL